MWDIVQSRTVCIRDPKIHLIKLLKMARKKNEMFLALYGDDKMSGKRMINFMAGLLFLGIFCLCGGAFGALPYDDAGLTSEKAAGYARIPSEVVFIDPSVPEMEKIVAQLPERAEVVRLSPGIDGVAQISAHLAKKRDLSAIHIISHGNAGHFVLNGMRIDGDFLKDHGHGISGWGRSLTENGDILFYACNLAATDEGKTFVGKFADLSSADVAASINNTGSDVFDGDWELEYGIGVIETTEFVMDNSYEYMLTDWTVDKNDDSGAGSLRNTIAGAATGDTVKFDANYTITLDSSITIDDKNLIIDGETNSIVILNGGTFIPFRITGTSALTFDSVTLQDDVSAGGVIQDDSSGLLTLTDVTLKGNVDADGGSGGVTVTGALTLTGSCTIDTDGSTDANISITGTVDGAAANTQDLTLNAGTGGTISVTGAVGGNTSLKHLIVANSNGATFTDNVTIGTQITLSDTTATADITFSRTLVTPTLTTTGQGYNVNLHGDGTIITNHVEFLNTGTLVLGSASGDTLTFNDGISIGSASQPSGTTLNGTVTTSNDPVALGTITVSGDSTVNPAGGAVTLGAITINDTKTLTVGTGNTGAVSFGSTINSASAYTGNLTINTDDTATFSNHVGGATAIDTLTLTAGTVSAGASDITAGTIAVDGGTFGQAASPTGNWDVGNVTIASGAAMNATTGGFNVSGNWDNAGTFNHKNGTVTLDGGSQSISGPTTFYNLEKNTETAATLTFQNGTANKTIVANTLQLEGGSGAILSLRSSSAGSQWEIDPGGTRTINYLDVKDSKNVNETAINAAGTNSVSSGNNTNWTFNIITPNTYYVNIQNGDNSLDGLSSAHAWETLHYAIDQINGGSAGSVGSGYTLNVLLGAIYNTENGEANSELTISQDYVTIIGETGSGPIINGTGATSWHYGIKIDASNVTLRNLYVTGFTGTDPSGTGIEIVSGSNNTIENCWVYGNHDGISVWQSANCTIQGCEIDNNNFDGISISESAGSIITQNTIHDNFETDNSDGIIVEACSPEISRNTIYDNRFNISLQGSETAPTSPTIKNNLIYELTLDEVHYGIIMGGSTGTVSPQVYHNTIDGSLYQGIHIAETGNTPIIKYNIVTNCRQSGIQNSGNPTIDYNDVWHNGPDPYDRNYDGCTAGAHDISQDPQYASHTLAVTSPCINAIPIGNPPNDPVIDDLDSTEIRPYGSGFDMGCYENDNLPAVTTTAASSITANSASSGGTVTSSGSETSVTAKGVCWSASANPTIALTTKTTDGTGLEAFTSSITGLTLNTTYHVRAYATNGENVTGYGSDKTFTTSAVTAPTLSSFSPTSGGTGTSVTITGTNFTDATAVKFGVTAASSFTVNSATQISAIVGSGSTGKVTATTSGGTATSTGDFTYTTIAAGTYYVNIATGNDSNDGSADHPWKTLHHAMSQINGGGAGTYVLRVALGTTYNVANGEADSQMLLSQSNVTIKGESGSAPIIDGTNAQTWTRGLEVTGSDVTLVNLYVTGFSDTNEEGIRISVGTGNEIRYCNVYGNSWGIRVNEATNTTIKNCDIYSNTTHGVDIVQSTGTSVVDNKIHDNPQYGIRVESSPEISRNALYDNQFGVFLDATTASTVSPVIKNNVIYEVVSNAMSYGIFMRSNNASVVNPKIYHNTIDGGKLDGIKMEKDGSSSSAPIIKYNIITEFGQYGINNSGAGPAIDYNDVWNNTASNYEGCTAGTNDLDPPMNPLYVTGSYSLQSASPCINTILSGDPVTLDYSGYKRPRPGKTTKDMGAYEYVADVTNHYTLPGGTGVSTDYRIFTVPLNLGTGTDMLTAMENVLGTYDPTHWRGFLYTGTSYREFNSSQFASHTIVPGMGFWIITTYTDKIPFEAKPAPDGVDYVMDLEPGWHLIGLPWLSTQITLSSIEVTDGVHTYAISSVNNDLTQRFMWDYTGSGPDNGYIKRSAVGFRLQNNKGYFFKVLAGTIRLIIPHADNQAQSAPVDIPPNQTNTNEDDEAPPPPPGEAPFPDIKANGQDGPVSVSSGDSISVSVSLDPGAWSGRNADWWVAVHTPFDYPLDWYTYVYPDGWRYGFHICAQTPLYELTPSFNVLNTVLPAGSYIFYFAVDGNMDGETDATWLDYVEVNVE